MGASSSGNANKAPPPPSSSATDPTRSTSSSVESQNSAGSSSSSTTGKDSLTSRMKELLGSSSTPPIPANSKTKSKPPIPPSSTNTNVADFDMSSNTNSNPNKQSQWERAWESDATNQVPGQQQQPGRTFMDRAHSKSHDENQIASNGATANANATDTNPEEEANRETEINNPAEENALSKQADEALKSGKAVAWDTSDLDGAKSTKPTVKHFSLLRVLGKGSFGKVVLVRKKFGLQIGGLFAMKVLRKSHLVKRHQIERTKTERRVLAVADHPFIMKLHFAFQNGEKLYLVLDYCPGGELFFHLCRHRRFPERVARFYAAELLLAIGHLHSIGIIYRDLKPENVLLDAEGHVKLGDFGLAKDDIKHATKGATSMCGTPEYMAPEVLLQRGHGFCVDYWGLGMLLFEMFTGLPPWYTTDKVKLFKRLKHAALVLPTFISAESGSVLRGLLEREPSRRLGFKGVESVRAHVFFNTVHWNNLISRKLTPPIRPCEGMKAPESRTSPMVINSTSSSTNNSSRGSLAAMVKGVGGMLKKDNSKKKFSTNSLSEFNDDDDDVNEFEKDKNNDNAQHDYNNNDSEDDKSIASDPGFSLSPDTIDNFTANFDPQFTRLAVDTDDSAAFPGSTSSVTSSQDGDNMFTGFTFDELNSMQVGSS